ncbi:hypothetical protein N781_10495 [Pontibacillus halophilus JSM 076056 = DSM 19796]|uniref:Aminoglycoside phosphotransferase domain-containing protein n=1 Tax=Pontibacillus halophilus JSM 076056 = DSM 19796 TaxID=1385510 RepID=A0A0A5GNS6_9BACI|nr:hypothetical protein [Pontibacillus halophilus]KGX93619.1 hypothetical protein N781_10495 [Pontibacillus halophilus JSM 076056 = DSM 19796]
MEQIATVLSHYELYPFEIHQKTDRLYRVSTQHGEVAVKRTNRTKLELHDWLEAYKTANAQQIRTLIPLYLTTDHQFFVEHERSTYYVMPWYENEGRDTPPYPFELFYKSIGGVHKSTLEAHKFELSDAEEEVKKQKEKVDGYYKQLEEWIVEFEQNHYMSPLELQVCTHFRDLIQCLTLTQEWYDRYLEDIETDKVNRVVLGHGNLRPSHFIYNADQPYLLNWERASVQQPVRDLTTYFHYVTRYHDAPTDQLIGTFSHYEDYVPLLNSERSLFAIYLLNPEHYLTIVEQYVTGAPNVGHPILVQRLERSYFVLKHALVVQKALEEARDYHISKENED